MQIMPVKQKSNLWLVARVNYEKHAPRVSQVIAAVAKVSCKHGLWLVARVNQRQFHSELPFCTLYSEDVRCFNPFFNFNPFFQIDADFLPVGCPS